MRHLTVYIFGLFLLTISCGQVDNKTTNTPQADSLSVQTAPPPVDGHSIVLSQTDHSSFIEKEKKYRSLISKDTLDWSATFQLGQLYHDESLYWSKLAETDSIKANIKSVGEYTEKASYFMKMSKLYLDRSKVISSEIGDADYPPAKH